MSSADYVILLNDETIVEEHFVTCLVQAIQNVSMENLLLAGQDEVEDSQP